MEAGATPEKVLITGGSGFLGVGVARLILQKAPQTQILLSDIAEHPRLAALGGRASFLKADLSDPQQAREILSPEISTVYHFASLVSGGAERDFEAGLKVNIFGTVNLFEACRVRGRRPKVIFTSSIATFGGSVLPETAGDLTHQHPQNSYGVAKVIGEQLLNDYSRKGFIDGRGVRLPAIVVRDELNSAASGYASSIIREPLQGRDYVCPVEEGTRIPILSVKRALALLVALAALPEGRLGDFRTLNGPGLSPTAEELAAAVLKTGRAGTGRIRFQPDPGILAVLAGWPKEMKSERAKALGLSGDGSVEEIVAGYGAERQGGQGL